MVENASDSNRLPQASQSLRLFLCGDVMTGRGIDQILLHPCNPKLHEPYVRNAGDYVNLAELVNGPIPRQVDDRYIWGDAMAEFERYQPDVRIINLETSVTTRSDYWKEKGIHYRMNPKNVGCLQAAKIDCCVLANNHVLDWGYKGLTQTLDALQSAGLKCSGAGENLSQAREPVIMEVGEKGRVIVLSYALPTSGVPDSWQACSNRAGVNFLEALSPQAVERISKQVRSVKQPNDIVVFSIHWGGNWGYEISDEQIEFAHSLIERAGVDVIHGHSSHHVKGLEVYLGKLILYGCGDFINDYEGISGHDSYRGDLALMYFLDMDPESGNLLGFKLVPLQMKRFQLVYPSCKDVDWIDEVLNRECRRFGLSLNLESGKAIALKLE
ncbi:CapA family protein [Thiomicrorhabdus sp. ZW0627]|uniref:CapA family protein n=1 Tax=Thiomicrorhabdus sp. ZW0627 TaxID=3039774 RepID=UPI0024367DC7|nr:CapA family protein [Thiomicrorhabdus sp. ZW0627]MDG6772787.1 CapA family protein [Thiomicrorhabdus sp. ZW0627]